jgi:hypothetical protein
MMGVTAASYQHNCRNNTLFEEECFEVCQLLNSVGVKGVVDMAVLYNFICCQLLKKVPKTEFLLHSFIAIFISVLNFEIELEMEPI